MLNNIGVIGLSTMGGNLARNIANKGFTVAIYNRHFEKTAALLELSKNQDQPEHAKNMSGFETLKDFVQSLELPRKIIVLVKAGQAVDNIIAELKPLLDSEDIIIDAGNSNWQDTKARELILEADFSNSTNSTNSDDKKIIHFMGCGISGGAEGALIGPSIMLGGAENPANLILPILQKIAAKDFAGQPCVSYLGTNPAGHFVKMVHNGIEYAIMQGIAEVYAILKQSGLENQKVSSIFCQLNTGFNTSFLLEITSEVLKTQATSKTSSNQSLVDLIVPKSGAKGTGKWTVEAALELGVAVPNIFEALNARIESNHSYNFNIETITKDAAEMGLDLEVDQLKIYLETIFLTSYLQGLDLILAAEKEYSWGINVAEVLRIWQGGCIIRSKWLQEIPTILNDKKLLQSSLYNSLVASSNLQQILNGQSIFASNPVFASSINYLKAVLYNQNGHSIIQAQRDYFGQHTYERTDKEGIFTGGWNLKA